ncbi:protein WHAT'S THIS FACTOR 9, mitochondrial-like isoform X2 [Apium graveolens]|uniref:protein WHAT'S THIS FACTOR 9, mitochondrial-like isoform X2 n=1 Tax=Apium graveolens TaxID=4045 RepID=UPI003D7BAC0E
MAQTTTSTANLRHILRRHYLYHHRRTFIDARIKWVRDPYLDHAVEKEKNLKQLLSLKNIILFHHSKTLAVAAVSGHLKLPTTPTKFIDKYPSVFNHFLSLKPFSHPQICSIENFGFGLELVSWRKDLAFSVMEMRVGEKGRRPIRFSMNLPRGFDLQKKVRDWVFEWNNLPYISPYEDASYLGPNTDQAEKWTVAVLHELLHLCVSKKTEIDNVCCLGDYLGFGTRFKKALKHHPGIFYMSNKIRTQTVVLREVYRKAALVDVHPLMEMRYRYIDLMNKRVKKNPLQVRPDGRKNLSAFPAGEGRINDIVIREQNVETKLGSSESEVESSDFEV